MARRDIEKIHSELTQIRQALEDRNTSLEAVQQDSDTKHRKVLEHVTYSTTGVREENREVRRRLDKLGTELGDTRIAVEALRREIAQAWAHTISAQPRPALDAEEDLAAQPDTEPKELPAGTDTTGGEGASVHDAEETAGQGQPHEAPPVEAQPTAATSPLPPSDDAPTGDVQEQAADPAETVAPQATPQTSALEEVATVFNDEPGEAPAIPGDTTVPEPDSKPDEHLQSLLRAAALSSARLVCHKDTWAFLIEQTVGHPHFRMPDQINDTADGQIETHLSGRSLLAVLVTMTEVVTAGSAGTTDLATWALAAAIQRRTRSAVAATTLDHPAGSQVTTIVLDDRPDRPHP